MRLLSPCLLITSLLFAGQSYAANKQNVRDQIRELRLDLRDSQANSRELDQVIELIEEAQDVLIGYSSGVDFNTCYQYVFPIYDQTTSSSAATTMATKACRVVQDMEVLKYSFDAFNRGTSTQNAMNKAVAENDQNIKGKLDIIKFAFGNYDRATSTQNAISKSLKQSKTVKIDALACLKLVFPKHDRTTSTMNAMDRSFRDCR